MVVRDAGDGWEEPEVERYTTALEDGRVVVGRVVAEGAVEPGCRVRVRGLGT